jgi:hypothetical protein
MVQDLVGADYFNAFIRQSGKLAVVDFSASW